MRSSMNHFPHHHKQKQPLKRFGLSHEKCMFVSFCHAGPNNISKISTPGNFYFAENFGPCMEVKFLNYLFGMSWNILSCSQVEFINSLYNGSYEHILPEIFPTCHLSSQLLSYNSFPTYAIPANLYIFYCYLVSWKITDNQLKT